MEHFIDKTPMHVTNVNPRKEGSGDGAVLASDISVSFQIQRKFMDNLIPQQDRKFSDIFYGEDGALRETKIAPITYHDSIESLRVEVFAGRRPMVFDESKIKSIKMTPNTGGYIDVDAMIQVRPSEVESGKLDGLTKTVVPVQVTAMVEQADIEGDNVVKIDA